MQYSGLLGEVSGPFVTYFQAPGSASSGLCWLREGARSLRLKTAQKPYIIWSLGPKALKYESSEP